MAIKRALALGGGLFMLVAARLAYDAVTFGCWQPLTRPSGVSPSAHLVCLLKNKTWFDCSVDAKRNVDVCRAWSSTGRLIADGDFRLEDEDRAAVGRELRPSTVNGSNAQAWRIYLFGPKGAFSRELVPFVGDRRVGLPTVNVGSHDPRLTETGPRPTGADERSHGIHPPGYPWADKPALK